MNAIFLGEEGPWRDLQEKDRRTERHLGKATSCKRESCNPEFELARSRQELERAYILTHEEYVRLGYMSPHPSGMRVSIYHALPTTRTFVARQERAQSSKRESRRL